MSVTVGELTTTVEVAPASGGGAAGGVPGGQAPLAPSWDEIERHRELSALEAEERRRTAGGGFDD